jgi:hypothetical protein
MAVIEMEGRLRITPDEVDAKDVLEYAELLIETEGWNPFKGDSRQESSDKVGWTLHDAIGEANRRLLPRHGKEGPRLSTGKNARDDAMAKLFAALPRRKWLQGVSEPDKTFNDRVTEVEEVLKVLRKARGAA